MQAEAHSPSRGTLSPVAGVVFTTVGFYLLFTVIALVLHSWDPLWFVWIGDRFANLDPSGSTGYDGQFIYYIARDGINALAHLDTPVYRLQRILLPAILRALTFGIPALIPWAMLAVNLTAVVLTVWLLASWLREQRLSPWYALVYPAYVGALMAYSRGLTEPLTYCLAAGGAIFWLRGRHAWSALLLSCAVLCKEIALLFIIGVICATLVRREWKHLVWPVLAVIPWVIWEALLYLRFGVFAATSGPAMGRLPLIGILPYLTLEPGRLSALFIAGIPALALFGTALVLLARERGRSRIVWWVLLNSLFVLLMPSQVYDHIMHAGRNAMGMILALALLLPTLSRQFRLGYTLWLALPTLFWVIPILRW
ncbi:MAG: AZOBR_p60025 family cell surface glycopolymer formation protein [Anaerolineae bacterium]